MARNNLALTTSPACCTSSCRLPTRTSLANWLLLEICLTTSLPHSPEAPSNKAVKPEDIVKSSCTRGQFCSLSVRYFASLHAFNFCTCSADILGGQYTGWAEISVTRVFNSVDPQKKKWSYMSEKIYRPRALIFACKILSKLNNFLLNKIFKNVQASNFPWHSPKSCMVVLFLQ